jgi:hypothetical protein
MGKLAETRIHRDQKLKAAADFLLVQNRLCSRATGATARCKFISLKFLDRIRSQEP